MRVGYQKKEIFYNVPLKSGFTNYKLFFSSMKRNRCATINNWSKMLTNKTFSKDSQKEVHIPIILKLDKEFYDMLNISRISKKIQISIFKIFFLCFLFFSASIYIPLFLFNINSKFFFLSLILLYMPYFFFFIFN